MKANNPKVSVCMPNYNFGHLIGEAIQSVLEQTFPDFELIIVDDASTDDSVAVIKRFSDERIRFYQNEVNIGRVKNINKSLSLASGDYVTILPSDCTCLPDSLEKRVAVLDTDTGIGVACGGIDVMDEKSRILSTHYPFQHSHVISGEDEFKKLIFGNQIPVITAMVRRECYSSLGLFNEAVTGAADFEMWLRICLNDYHVAFIPDVLARDREHPGDIAPYFSQSNLSGMNTYRVLKATFASLPPDKKHLGSFEPQAVKALARKMLIRAWVNFLRGQGNLARKNAGLAIAIDDSMLKDWKTAALFIASFFGWCLPLVRRLLPGPVKRAIYAAGRKALAVPGL